MEGIDQKDMETTRTTAGVNSLLDNLRDLRADMKHESASGVTSQAQLSASDNTSVAYAPPPEDLATLISQLRAVAHEADDQPVAAASDFWLSACLHARKGDTNRSRALAANLLAWRQSAHFESHTNPLAMPLREVLEAGIFVVPGCETRDGRPVVSLRIARLNPRMFSPMQMARTLVLVFEYVLHTFPRAMTHGVVLVHDASNVSFRNFDIRLVRFLEKALSRVIPVRVAAIYILNPNIFIRAVFTLVSGFMSDKLKTRIQLFGPREKAKFEEVFSPENTPHYLNMGGTLVWDDDKQTQLTQKIQDAAASWAPATSYPPS